MKKMRVASLLMVLILLFNLNTYASSLTREYSSYGADDGVLKSIMEEVIVFRIDNPQAYVKNVKLAIETGNSKITPILKDNRVYIPLEFTLKNAGISVNDELKLGNRLAENCEDEIIESRNELFCTPEAFSEAYNRDIFRSGNLIIVKVDEGKIPRLSNNVLNKLEEMMLYKWENVYLGANGYATGIMTHPKEPSQIYCRTDVGGAYRYNHENEVWVSITDNVSDADVNPTHFRIMGMALDPNDTETIYIATLTDVLKTTDGGVTWKELGLKKEMSEGQNRLIGEPIAVDPNNSDVVYYGSDSEGLFISRDGGTTWKAVPGVPANADYGIRCITFDKASVDKTGVTQRIFAGVSGHGVYVSENGGKSFRRMPGSPTHQARMKYVGDRLYVSQMLRSSKMSTDVPGGIYVYRNNKWKNITPKGGADKDFAAIAVRESDPDFIITVMAPYVSTRKYKSTDGGETWTALGSGVNIADMCFNPLNEKEIFYVYGAGVNKITDADDNSLPEVRFDVGIEEFCTAQILSVPGSEARLFTGNLDWGMYRSTEIMQRASRVGNPIMADTTGLDYCGTDSSFVMAVGSSINYGKGVAQMEYSTDYGETWNMVDSWDGGLHLLEVAVGAEKQENGFPVVMACAFDGNPGYYISRDGLKTWEKTSISFSATDIWARWHDRLIADKVNGDVFYIQAKNQIYVTKNAGLTWTVASGIPGACNLFYKIVAAPGIEGTIVYVGKSTLYISRDYGSTWRECNDIEWSYNATFGKGKDGSDVPALYVYGKINGVLGIYLSDDLGESWRRINDDGNQIPCVGDCGVMCGDKNEYGRVFVSTAGRGTFAGQPVTLKDSKPILKIDELEYSVVGNEVLTISGSVSQNAEVRINNIPVEIDGNLGFAADVILSEGDNVITVEAVSENKYKAEPQFIKVRYVPGYVGISINHEEDYISKEKATEIFVKSSADGYVVINGASYNLDADRTFRKSFELSEGENPFEIYSVNMQDEKSEVKSFSARYDTTAPEYSIVNKTEMVDRLYHILKLNMKEDGQFRVNGNVVDCKKDKDLEYLLLLNNGDNNVLVEARDLSGNVAKPVEFTIGSKAVPIDTANITAKYISPDAIKLDGVTDEKIWTGEHLLTRKVEGSANNVARFDTYWNEEYLYIGVQVSDGMLVFNSDEAYQDDDIEVYIDADNCKANKYCAGTRQMQFRADGQVVAAGCISKATMNDSGYTMEIAIPWKTFGVAVEEGTIIGFDIGCIDDDGTKSSGSRTGVLGWNNPKNTNYSSPKDYANLKLIK